MTQSPHEEAVLLGPAVLGLLTAVEQQRLDAHLAGCATCRDELAALTAVAGRLRELDAEQALVDDAARAGDRAAAVLAAVGRAQQQERRRGRQAVLAAAASVAVLAAGVVGAVGLARDDDAPAVPLEAVAVRADTGVDAQASLVAHTWGVEIKLVAAGLEAGEAYDVRVTTTGGEVVDAGAFLGTGARTLTCSLNASVLRADAAAFTVVDAGGEEVLSAQL